MIINSSGVALTQKKQPKMCLIKPNIDLDARELSLMYKGSLKLLFFVYFYNEEC